MCIGSLASNTQRQTLGLCIRCDHYGTRSGKRPAVSLDARGVASCDNFQDEAPLRLKPAHPSLRGAARPGGEPASTPAPSRARSAHEHGHEPTGESMEVVSS